MTDDQTETREDQLRAFAADLLLDDASKLDFLTVVETAHDRKLFPDGFTDEDAEYVHDLALRATLRVSWPDHEYVYGTSFDDDETDGDDDTAGE